MNWIDAKAIATWFKILNESGVVYLLLRNIADELPDTLSKGKDIDLWIHPDCRKEFKTLLDTNHFKKLRHPHQEDRYLYACDPFEFYQNEDQVLLDVQYQWIHRSLQPGMWLPLDQSLQESAFKNKVWVEKEAISYWTFGVEEDLVCLLSRCILDKKVFPKSYCDHLELIKSKADRDMLTHMCTKVFFKFAPRLVEMLMNAEYEKMVPSYIQFRDY